MKPGLDLNKVVLLGRTFDEYVRYFGLSESDLRGKRILDIASGVSSFTAEANERGFDATACDLIYSFSPGEIRQKCEPDLDFVINEIGKASVSQAYRWKFYGNPEGVRRLREEAYKKFLQDFEEHPQRYVFGRLPQLPFADRQFDLTLVSYLLFVYEDQLDYKFHKESLREIMRITAGEARFYPLVNFRAERCSFLDRIKSDAGLADLRFDEVKTDFEFLANSNWFLRITRK